MKLSGVGCGAAAGGAAALAVRSVPSLAGPVGGEWSAATGFAQQDWAQPWAAPGIR